MRHFALDPGEPYLPRVREVVELADSLAAWDDAEVAAGLMRSGYSERDAELAVALVPLAFARLILFELGITQFASTFEVRDSQGRWISRSLPDEPWYRAAMRIAAATRTHGYATDGCAGETVTRAQFGKVILGSTEMNAANDALNAGEQIAGTSFGPPRFHRLAAEWFA